MNLVAKSGRVFQISTVLFMLVAGSLVASAYQKKTPSAPKPAAPHAASKPAAKAFYQPSDDGGAAIYHDWKTWDDNREAWDDKRSEAGHEPARNWEHE